MLEKLDDINWNELRESFGDAATDVPKDIRKLLSPSKEVRKDAIISLGYSICNDHILGTATLETIPFLLDLLKDEAVLDKHEILYLITDCYIRYDKDPMDIIPTQPPRVQLKIKITQVILEGMDIYFELLNHNDWKVRLATIEFIALRFFPQHMRQQIEYHYQDFKAKETYPDIQKLFPELDEYRAKYFTIPSDD